MKSTDVMTPNDLANAGRALYGDRWQTALAHALHVSDRTMRRWLAGDFSIPAAIVSELRSVLVERLNTLGGMVRYMVNPQNRTIYHSVTYAAFQYDDAGTLILLHPGMAATQEIPLIAEGAKEALRREQERDPRVKFTSADQAGQVTKVDQLHGFLRGSVIIPDGFDLTAPVVDEPFSAEGGELHK
jgi:hypothetical protein